VGTGVLTRRDRPRVSAASRACIHAVALARRGVLPHLPRAARVGAPGCDHRAHPAPTRQRDLPVGRTLRPPRDPGLLGRSRAGAPPGRSSAGSRSLSGAAGGRDNDDSACKPLTRVPDRRATVCLPTYNERENLEPMLRALGDAGVRVLVVDDNSPDGTGRLADRLAQKLDYVDVLHRSRKEGPGPANIAGFR